jgi:ABC-type multidrug transport system ATPase subunit
MMIENNCNKILSKITDFTLSIVYDKEVKIFTLENDIAIPASMGSGMQKFVLDLIFRITLTQISSISCPKTLFVDEGFGSLDAENFIAIANILQKLKGDFDSLIIISHITELRNYVDMSIDITRKGYLSSVKFGGLTDDQKTLSLSAETNIINKRNTDFVNASKDAKRPKVDLNDTVQKYCDDNGGIESLLMVVSESNIYCKACKKEYQPKHGFIERHLNAATSKSKHDKFLTSLSKN